MATPTPLAVGLRSQTLTGPLGDCQLHEVERLAHTQLQEQVHGHKRRPAMLVAEVRETPHVAQSHTKADTGQNKLRGVGPLCSGLRPLDLCIGHRRR